MKPEEVVRILTINMEANKDHPKFQEACETAITALDENRMLKNRCRIMTQGALCGHCKMECENRIGR